MDVPAPNITEIPCDLLLILAGKLDPEDYLSLSSVSKSIRNCLKHGKYTKEEEEAARNFIEEQKEKIKSMIENVRTGAPSTISQFPNAPEKVKLMAIKQNPYVIRRIKNPSERLQLAAVEENGLPLEYIENPSEKVQLTAVKNNGYAIKYIENPSEDVQLAAVRECWEVIKHIKNPTEKVRSLADRRRKRAEKRQRIKRNSDL